jgi:hypothetical protein
MPRNRRTPDPATPAEGGLRVHGHAPRVRAEQNGACAACGVALPPGCDRCDACSGWSARTTAGYRRELEASRARQRDNPERDPIARARALYEAVRTESERRRKGGRPAKPPG